MKTILILTFCIALIYNNSAFSQPNDAHNLNNFSKALNEELVLTWNSIYSLKSESVTNNSHQSANFKIDLKLNENPPKEIKKGKMIAGAVIFGTFNATGLILIGVGSSRIKKSNNNSSWGDSFGNSISGVGYNLTGASLMTIGTVSGIPLMIRGKNPKQPKEL